MVEFPPKPLAVDEARKLIAECPHAAADRDDQPECEVCMRCGKVFRWDEPRARLGSSVITSTDAPFR